MDSYKKSEGRIERDMRDRESPGGYSVNGRGFNSLEEDLRKWALLRLSPRCLKTWLESTQHVSSVTAPSIILSLALSCPSISARPIHLQEVLTADLSQVQTLK